MAVRPLAAASLVALAISLGACQDSTFGGGGSTRHLTPIPQKTLALMQTKGMSQTDPILIRAYKKEAEMEVWKRGSSGQYALLKTFPICRWSGQLGPKTKQGDRQAPEGFYTITPGQMNPNSSYYLSFDTGYPNAFDRANGRNGNYIMVHGTCSSAGCFAMTDESMAEIYAIAREAFAGGQRGFQFQSYPFRMTAQNFARFRNDPNAAFWKNLKEGSDYFEALKDEPRVGLCGNRYVFGGADAAAGSCSPKVDTLVAEKRERDNREIAELVGKGTAATRVVYDDGGQNPVFRQQPQQASAFASLGSGADEGVAYAPKDYARHNLGEVSRPETLAAGPREIEVDAKGRPLMTASIEAPIPTKAAAAALARKEERKGTRKEEPSLVAQAAPAPEAAKPATPARVTVADADGDPSAYRNVFGNLFAKGNPAPATPAADAATVPAAAAPEPPKPGKPAHAVKALAPTKPVPPTKTAQAVTPAPAQAARKEAAAPAAKPSKPEAKPAEKTASAKN
ncbi:murein L,D-transpeptidase family protein [Methylobacterium durans]|uniref:murein L,D-transpeptidase family protein n=1 Tax=Methylobacterium durans TaxID=2202825 RepID=UPI002AFE5F38|nr:murein L,D-transpeptidase family protein [Methylobacterium durans]MEA1833969.1 murein L,D-transpeptidase family protein [Methylobacterium durans]